MRVSRSFSGRLKAIASVEAADGKVRPRSLTFTLSDCEASGFHISLTAARGRRFTLARFELLWSRGHRPDA